MICRLREVAPPETTVLEESARDDWADAVQQARRSAIRVVEILWKVSLCTSSLQEGSYQYS